MRYLKRYNEEVESFDNIISDIKDMSLDITDEDTNYTINVYSNNKINIQSKLYIDIIYGDDNILILNDEAFNFLERVDKYIIDNGFKASVISYSDAENEHDVDSDQHYTKFKDMESLIDNIGSFDDEEDDQIDSIRLEYRKDIIKEGFFDIFKRNKYTKPKGADYNKVIELSNDCFIDLTDSGYIVKNMFIHHGQDWEPYIQITKHHHGNKRKDIPYKFIDVKDDVLSFCDRVKEYDISIEFAFVYENDKGGLSKDNPTYHDFNSGKYDDREVSILTIYMIGFEDVYKYF
jgi:hypothetical protein